MIRLWDESQGARGYEVETKWEFYVRMVRGRRDRDLPHSLFVALANRMRGQDVDAWTEAARDRASRIIAGEY